MSHKCKVILVGESGVGKTCITNKFIKGTFNKEEVSTLAASYAEKNMYLKGFKETIKFNIWDTAGQERFFFGCSRIKPSFPFKDPFPRSLRQTRPGPSR